MLKIQPFSHSSRRCHSCLLNPKSTVCPFSVLVQQPSRDGDEGDPRWISRWAINWRANDTNLSYADAVILLATLEAELQESVDRLDLVICKYSLLINVDKTKVMASKGIACHILIQNEQL